MEIKSIQIDFASDAYYVQCITDKEEIEQDSVFSERRQAEDRAEWLAKVYACPWETNYGDRV